MFWNGFDVSLAIGRVPEHSAKSEYVVGEVAFLDKRVWPDFLEEIVLRDEAAGPGSQRRQNVERLRRQRNRNAIPQQETFGHVESKVAELQTNMIVHRIGVSLPSNRGRS